MVYGSCKLLLELDSTLNENVSLYKAKLNLGSKEKAIQEILGRYFAQVSQDDLKEAKKE